MEMSPQSVRTASFKTVRKGADPEEIQAFLGEVADELERAQNESAAMEARARAAVARLKEVTERAGTPEPAAAPEVSVDESETISRTLLLAQRTADSTVADARSEAARIVQAANSEATSTLDSSREMAAQLLDEARTAARQAGEAERITVSGEVDALKARRDFLESDVEQLEMFLADQRSRLRESATALVDIAERVPGGLAAVRPPLLSASDDDDVDASDAGDTDASSTIDDDTGELDAFGDDDTTGLGSLDEAAEPTESSIAPSNDLLIVADLADAPAASTADDPTEAIAVTPRDDDGADHGKDTSDNGGEILFSFDDDRR